VLPFKKRIQWAATCHADSGSAVIVVEPDSHQPVDTVRGGHVTNDIISQPSTEVLDVPAISLLPETSASKDVDVAATTAAANGDVQLTGVANNTLLTDATTNKDVVTASSDANNNLQLELTASTADPNNVLKPTTAMANNEPLNASITDVQSHTSSTSVAGEEGISAGFTLCVNITSDAHTDNEAVCSGQTTDSMQESMTRPASVDKPTLVTKGRGNVVRYTMVLLVVT
jgi:hypothetical protein